MKKSVDFIGVGTGPFNLSDFFCFHSYILIILNRL